MLRYQATASIEAPLEAAWHLLRDVLHWNTWTPTVTRVEALDGPDLAPGHRFRVEQPKLRPAIWSVTQVEASSFSWESRAPGVRMLAEHTLESTTSGRLALTLGFSFQGVLGGLVGRLNRKLVESYLATEAASLRRRVEADVASLT